MHSCVQRVISMTNVLTRLLDVNPLGSLNLCLIKASTRSFRGCSSSCSVLWLGESSLSVGDPYVLHCDLKKSWKNIGPTTQCNILTAQWTSYSLMLTFDRKLRECRSFKIVSTLSRRVASFESGVSFFLIILIVFIRMAAFLLNICSSISWSTFIFLNSSRSMSFSRGSPSNTLWSLWELWGAPISWMSRG